MGLARRRRFDIRRALAERGAVERGVADTLRAAAGLRTRIEHGYAMLDYSRVRDEALLGIPALRTFLEAVARDVGL